LGTASLYGLAWWSHRQGRTDLALAGILVAGLGLRVFCALDPMPHTWDERYHALVAKHVVETPLTPRLYPEPLVTFEPRGWNTSHVWLHKQPLPAWIAAISLWLGGNTPFVFRLPTVLLSTLGIWLIFLIGRALYDHQVGLLAAGLMSINGLVIELTAGRVATDHIDVYFLVLVEASVYGVILARMHQQRRYLLWAGIACGLAILCKWLPALVVYPIYLALNGQDQPWRKWLVDGCWLGIPALLVAAPWQGYAAWRFPELYQWEQAFNARHITEGLEGHAQPWWYFLDRIRITVNEGIYLVIGWFGYHAWQRRYPPADRLLLTWLLIPLVFFSLVQTKMQGYLLFSFPAYFLMMAVGLVWLAKQARQTQRVGSRRGYQLVAWLLILLAFRYGMERVKPFASHPLEAEARAELDQLALPPHSVVFGVACPIEFMFLTEGQAYDFWPEEPLIESLQAQGYQVWLVNREEMPAPLRSRSDLRQIALPAATRACPEG
jgi:4-amino-4-deoxy-L-arabinose transferase